MEVKRTIKMGIEDTLREYDMYDKDTVEFLRGVVKSFNEKRNITSNIFDEEIKEQITIFVRNYDFSDVIKLIKKNKKALKY